MSIDRNNNKKKNVILCTMQFVSLFICTDKISNLIPIVSISTVLAVSKKFVSIIDVLILSRSNFSTVVVNPLRVSNYFLENEKIINKF